jgi:hypothetical protein
MNELIKHHAMYPSFAWWLKEYNITYSWNDWSCWNKLSCFMKIEDNKVKELWFSWDTSMYVNAWFSIVWSEVLWWDINDVLKINYKVMDDYLKLNIRKTRKKMSFCLWLLCVINAINKYKWNKEIYLSDLI